MASKARKTATGVGVATIIAAAVAFIKPWESPGGKPQLTAYRDIVGVWTACYGETNIDPRRTYAVAECDQKIQADVESRMSRLDKCITRDLQPNQWVAVISLSYNAGVPATCGSTLVRMINSGATPEQWCPQLLRWVYAGGKRVQGLANRRQDELSICLARRP